MTTATTTADPVTGKIAMARERDAAALVQLELGSEAPSTPEVRAFSEALAAHVLEHRPGNVDELLDQPWHAGSTVEQARADVSASIGEHVTIAQVAALEANGVGVLGTWLDDAGVGVIVDVAGPDTEDVRSFATDVAKHVASAAPRYLARGDVPQGAADAGSDAVLLEQAWAPAADRLGARVSIGEYARLTSERVGLDVAIRGFARFPAAD